MGPPHRNINANRSVSAGILTDSAKCIAEFQCDRLAASPLTSTSFSLAPKVGSKGCQYELARLHRNERYRFAALDDRIQAADCRRLVPLCVNWRRLVLTWTLTGSPDGMFTAGVHYCFLEFINLLWLTYQSLLQGPISESDFFTWEALICGPKDTPFVSPSMNSKGHSNKPSLSLGRWRLSSQADLCMSYRIAARSHTHLSIAGKPSDYPLSPFKMKFDPPLFHPNSKKMTVLYTIWLISFCSLRWWKRLYIHIAYTGWRPYNVWTSIGTLESSSKRRESHFKRYFHVGRYIKRCDKDPAVTDVRTFRSRTKPWERSKHWLL